ncbi:hypothetical protein C1E23_01200 [Pseudoalteromonas phenolica]|uniref:Uncharacterized protein n=1 Tax=Pseudoalteromonas phenolica TaxID=161398 RepID=A0A4Q7ISE2_9GAMM|nr:hypothetical protein [Pseudoalteromonas phenolica]RZQ54931.1 hypothetical protein C1E23_01200 [Pseudoalteromonas phenolica]
MKTALILLAALLVISALSWIQTPVMFFVMPEFIWQISWVGMELFALLAGIIAVIALVALVSVGVIGLVLVVLIGLVLALLFNSIFIALPLLLLVGLAWLLKEESMSY